MSRFADIAKTVRLTPTTSESKTASEAIEAPIRTAGESKASLPASTAVASGAGDEANTSVPAPATTLTATHAYAINVSISAIGIARGIVRKGERVIFVHTGGLAGMFAYAKELADS